MKYYNDMLTKYGFGDGEAVPDNAEIYRTVYIFAINHIAEKFDSKVRVVAYDRPGMHNWCMIVMVSKEKSMEIDADIINRSLDENNEYDEYTLTTGLAGEVVCLDDLVEQDEAMEKAINHARELGLDDYVVESAEIDPDFQDTLISVAGKLKI